jgi:hypothetical protein
MPIPMGVNNKLQGLFGTSPVGTHGTGNAQAEEAMAACLRLFPVLRDPCEPKRVWAGAGGGSRRCRQVPGLAKET